MEALVILVHSCMASLRKILSIPELSPNIKREILMQLLRLRLWEESFGLQNNLEQLQRFLNENRGVKETLIQSINELIILLTEIKISAKSKSQCPRDLRRSSPFMKQEIQGKQVLLDSMTNPPKCNSSKLAEKIDKVKYIIDNLENVSKLGRITCKDLSSPPDSPTSTLSMSDGASNYKRMHHIHHRRPPPLSLPIYREDSELPKQYLAMQMFIEKSLESLQGQDKKANTKGREVLTRLSNSQMLELRVDIYDESIRREQSNSAQFLSARSSFDTKRNRARRKLSSLPLNLFHSLVKDVLIELDRRFPSLRNKWQQIIGDLECESKGNYFSPFYCPSNTTNRRNGCVLSPSTPSTPSDQSEFNFGDQYENQAISTDFKFDFPWKNQTGVVNC